MNRKITAFAFAGKCGFFGASGSLRVGAATASRFRSDASATVPIPTPEAFRNSRREWERPITVIPS